MEGEAKLPHWLHEPVRTAADSIDEVATMRIELADSDSLIWREVEVPTSDAYGSR